MKHLYIYVKHYLNYSKYMTLLKYTFINKSKLLLLNKISDK